MTKPRNNQPVRMMLLAAAALVMGCAAARAAAPPSDTLTDAQKTEIRAMVKDYILANPDVLVESLNSYQSKQAADEQKNFKSSLGKYQDFLTSKDTPFGGNPNGKKTVVEFFDYNCGYCKRAVDDVVNIIKDDGDVKVYFKDMPILADTSADAARWALAAGKQGKYYEFHVALMKSPLSRETATYKKIAADLKLDVDKMQKDAEGDAGIRTAIEKNLDAARNLGIHGTPGFIINGVLYPGYIGLDMMKKAVNGGEPDAAPAPTDAPKK